jgi:quinol monooxygenase YgiN
MIQVIVFYSLKEEFITQFTAAFNALEPHVRAEEGCLQYEVFSFASYKHTFLPGGKVAFAGSAQQTHENQTAG